jgi:hypothetical protein
MQKVQKALYAKLDEYTARAANTVAGLPSPDCLGKWRRETSYIVPWTSAEGEEDGVAKEVAIKPFPKSCGLYSQATFEYRKKR